MDWPLDDNSTLEEACFWLRELVKEHVGALGGLAEGDKVAAQRLTQAAALGASLADLDMWPKKPGRSLAHVFCDFPLALNVALKGGASAAAADEAGMTPLHVLSQKLWSPQVDQATTMLLQAGCPLDAPDLGGRSPLAYAAKGLDSPLVFELIALGADSTMPDVERARPIWASLALSFLSWPMLRGGAEKDNDKGSGDFFKKWRRRFDLATAAADLDWAGQGSDLMERAAQSWSAVGPGLARDVLSEKMSWMASQGAPVDARDNEGWTCLASACAHGDQELFDLLIHLGADIEARASGGMTPLMAAAWNGRGPLVSKLLAAGARVDAKDDLGRSAHDLAIEYGGLNSSIAMAIEILELDALIPKVVSGASASAPAKRARL
jgi:hypothetical protein